MNCFDEPTENERAIRGDFYSDQFNYFRISLTACVSSATNKCANSSDVKAFYQANSNFMFMYVDSYIDINEYKYLIEHYLNQKNFVPVDLAYIS
jgi:hypothetical protein